VREIDLAPNTGGAACKSTNTLPSTNNKQWPEEGTSLPIAFSVETILHSIGFFFQVLRAFPTDFDRISS